jgi:3-hydroxyisobutyrate dehydrogenase-like beta-hydroxyacid dehydrogenase
VIVSGIPTIGWIGTGKMGLPMAVRAMQAGFYITGPDAGAVLIETSLVSAEISAELAALMAARGIADLRAPLGRNPSPGSLRDPTSLMEKWLNSIVSILS